jgi:hypothetical protein
VLHILRVFFNRRHWLPSRVNCQLGYRTVLVVRRTSPATAAWDQLAYRAFTVGTIVGYVPWLGDA